MNHRLIKNIKLFVLKNYENGYDTIAECWNLDDYVQWIERHNITTVDEFVASYAPVIERQEEMFNTIF